MTDGRRAAWPAPLLLCAALWCGGVGAARAAEPIVDFVVVRADTLIGLSRTVLVSPTAWREVARLNRLPNPNRLRPGQRLRIPARLLRADAVSATLVSVSGDVRSGDAPAAAGAAIAEGQSLQTGADGSAVLALADGSRVQLPPSSLAQVAASRNLGARPAARAAVGAEPGGNPRGPSHWFAGTMRLLRGSVEIVASKVPRARPLEVVTPTAVVGVRGTRYRVGYDEAANGRTRIEVVEGAVRFETSDTKAAAEVAAGFGAAVDAGAAPSVARLLPAPDLAALPARFERPIVRFASPDATTPLRVQVASDAAFERIASDQQVAPGAEVRVAGLPDAAWQLRVRRIDARGVEGFDTTRGFVLKARPEPPAYQSPRSDAKQTVGSVEFAWALNVEAPRVRLQLAADDAFTRVLDDRDNVEASSLSADLAQPGVYHWRLASVRPDGDHGPFGDPQRFELRPAPEPPAVERTADGSALRFRWSGRAGDRYQVEFARDLAFQQVVERAELGTAEWSLATPASSGRYYFRYRSVEPDGFVSPYSETLQVEVARDWRWLGVLVPVLLMLF